MIDTGAVFSKCKQYRYDLWRLWDNEKGSVAFIMLNPSTADETKNDPTVERCQRFAKLWGFGGMYVCNIFAFRTTYPKELLKMGKPIGPRNNAMILKRAKEAQKVVCAWGNHGIHLERGDNLLLLLKKEGITPETFGLTQMGQPKHPLYLRKTAETTPF
jgi:hypothetical protein